MAAVDALRALGRRVASPSALWKPGGTHTAHCVAEAAQSPFVGFRSSSRRTFFSHRFRVLPKAGPEGLRLARWMAGIRSADALWQIVLHAEPEAVEGIPGEAFFDPELIWHQQHLGLPGHVAYACLARRGRTLYALNYVSDVAQRVARRPAIRSRVENRFGGWPDLLVHAVLHFAVETGCRRIRSVVADHALRFTDREREVGRELFDRVYDRTVTGTLEVERRGRWWQADVAANAGRRLPTTTVRERLTGGRTVCVFHDIEAGSGHVREDPALARRADAAAPQALAAMLRIEREANVTATYNVVGTLLSGVREEIERDGHALAFHSHDHTRHRGQLQRCREVDYRLRGYRSPQSRLTWEITDRALCWHNFDWLALSGRGLGVDVPVLERRVVKIPVLLDDYALYRHGMPFDRWADDALRRVRDADFAAIGLHDCYGDSWMEGYPRFLDELSRLETFATLDEVADRVFLGAAV